MIIAYVIITVILFRWTFEKLIIIIKEVFFFITDIFASFSKVVLIIKSILIDVWLKEVKVIIDEMCDVFLIKDESS